MKPLKVLLLLVFFPISLWGEYKDINNVKEVVFGIVAYRGGDWYNNIDGVRRFLKFLKTNLNLPIETEPRIISLESNELFDCDIIYISGHEPISFNDKEVENLRKFVRAGGFIFANDDYGMDESFRREIKKVFPSSELVELPFSHYIYHIYYKFPRGLPKIHEHYQGPPKGLGIIQNGQLVLFYVYNSDIGDGWDAPEVHNDPLEKRLQALKMGANIILSAILGF